MMAFRFLKSLLAAVCLAVLCPAHADEGYPARIRIGIQKGDGLVALRASGKLEQAFAVHHVNVTWHEFVYGAPLVEAINAGDVDVGTVGSTPPIMAQAGAAPAVVYVAYAPKLVKSYAIVVPKDSPVQNLHDLKGRKIAFAKGSQGHLFVLKALQDAHMAPDSAQFAYLSYGDARSAFERGFVDAWAVPDPRYADTELSTGARTILTIGDLSVPQYGFYISTRDFAQKYPAALRLLFDELGRQTRENLAHPEDTARFLSGNTGVPLQVWDRAISRLEWGVGYPIPDEVLRAQQDSANLAFDTKVIPRRIDVRQAVLQIK
ncbi:aliphatic sulfonate ABC transporter substrate-binding protein [Caballeronia sp. LZ034LL]|uniref:aliphatic sulfonate ABC transporter substrate-binding protein n=1 Tax=Caballeronia sp. LZ034LL TaxID=3038567 RepID=UPI0028590792|nr:aliphatic sulfonate ABC transporter substrate-binding protein [Caballeronia sp. LZ034LL]MDR5836045.1 aliphatic sulfonate ABC transporter substrate-binding protein [Caballeronia sp. LZ034LL]